MNDAQTFTAGLQFTLSNLCASSVQNQTPTQLEKCEPFQLSVTVTFSDTAGGNLINLLMPLGLAVRVNFSARSLSGPGSELDLGHVTLITEADVVSYTPTLVIAAGPESVGLDPQTVYQIKALVRVGHAPFSMPTLGRGFINGLDLPVGQTPSDQAGVVTPDSEKPQVELKVEKPPTRTRASRSKSPKA